MNWEHCWILHIWICKVGKREVYTIQDITHKHTHTQHYSSKTPMNENDEWCFELDVQKGSRIFSTSYMAVFFSWDHVSQMWMSRIVWWLLLHRGNISNTISYDGFDYSLQNALQHLLFIANLLYWVSVDRKTSQTSLRQH